MKAPRGAAQSALKCRWGSVEVPAQAECGGELSCCVPAPEVRPRNSRRWGDATLAHVPQAPSCEAQHNPVTTIPAQQSQDLGADLEASNGVPMTVFHEKDVLLQDVVSMETVQLLRCERGCVLPWVVRTTLPAPSPASASHSAKPRNHCTIPVHTVAPRELLAQRHRLASSSLCSPLRSPATRPLSSGQAPTEPLLRIPNSLPRPHTRT